MEDYREATMARMVELAADAWQDHEKSAALVKQLSAALKDAQEESGRLYSAYVALSRVVGAGRVDRIINERDDAAKRVS